MSQRLPVERGEPALEHVARRAERLWRQQDVRRLVDASLKLLSQDFHVPRAAFIAIELGPTAPEGLVANDFWPADWLSEEARQAIMSRIPSLRNKLGEDRAGISHYREGSIDLSFVLLESGSTLEAMVVWQTVSGSPGGELNLLAQQLQNQWSYLRRFDRSEHRLHLDDLTGLYNYHYLEKALDHELLRAQRFENPFCLLFIDIDDFKSINDRFGHPVGSAVLKQVGSLLRQSLREVDCVVRYGGDEFVVMLLGALSRTGFLAAERIRRSIEGSPIRVPGCEPIRLTVSVGVAAFPEHARDKQTLVQLADQMMYRGKRNGKNQVGLAEDQSSQPTVPEQRS